MQSLTNGRYKVVITPAGGGQSMWDWIALSRWVEDARGFFIYLRDLDSNGVWSAGALPVCAAAERYTVTAGEGRCTFERADHGIGCKMEVAVSATDDLEVRRVTLSNPGPQRRRLELTSYIEVALGHPGGDLGHPAFSKLFVQTEREGSLLLAKRRPRSQGETWPVMFHALVGAEANECETDRLRFIGRGRSLARPAALRPGVQLSCTVGNVLDPIFSLRTEVSLEPGASVELSFILGAAPDQAAVADALGRLHATDAIARLFPPVSLSAVATGSSPAKTKPLPAEPVIMSGGGEALHHFNGIGGFNADSSEYVMRLKWVGDALQLPPMPWINVLANPGFGCLVSETGEGCTWSRNSQANRLTPWSNDPVTDPHDEAFYVRDEDNGAFWSPLPGPAPAPADYETRHSHGCTRYSVSFQAIHQEVSVFVARRDPVKLVRVRLVNQGDRSRRLSIFSYQRLVLGSMPQTPCPVRTWQKGEVLCAENTSAGDFAGATVFSLLAADAGVEAQQVSCDRQSFLGGFGSSRAPAALNEPALDGVCGAGMDACFARQVQITLLPGQTFSCCFVLGEALDPLQLDELAARYSTIGAVHKELEQVEAFWRDTLGGLRVRTPVPEIDLMVNGWLPYQALACRMWGRTAFYQSSGAYGFRDQLQDAGNVSLLWPDITRSQILLHARHQFGEGDVLHWWHDRPVERGVRTRFADDLLWLPLVTLNYVQSTGDVSVLDEQVPFLSGEVLAAGQDENYFKPDVSRETATVYEHCRRAIERSLTAGVHGLPLMGTGDWNDGMNRVGREGRGESVWMGFFLYQILGDFIPLAVQRGDHTLEASCRAYRDALQSALNEAGWDGDWYRRAYYDDGTPLGTKGAHECQIDGLAQAWAVLSGAAPPERAAQAMDAVMARLVVEDPGLIKLLTPPFVNTPHDPGYIKGYVAGVRENGGQYTHASCWVVMAMARLGRRECAAHLLTMLSPVWHTRTPERLEAYIVEPYVIAADVYGAEPHLGRGGWTWYTGSAGWAWRAAVESVLGLRLVHGLLLVIKPCVPDGWPGFQMDYRHPGTGTEYHVEVVNTGSGMAAVRAVTIDGVAGEVVDGAAQVPISGDSGSHRVVVTMGGAG